MIHKEDLFDLETGNGIKKAQDRGDIGAKTSRPVRRLPPCFIHMCSALNIDPNVEVASNSGKARCGIQCLSNLHHEAPWINRSNVNAHVKSK